jgi:cell wall-associated NlpC family hydrolase
MIKEIIAQLEQIEIEMVEAQLEIIELKKQIPAAWEVKADTVIAIARAFDVLAIPYVFGGESRTGMDCSGFTQTIYRNVGVNLPRVSKDQARTGVQVDKTDASQWRKGDLIAFDYSKDGTVDHIGIYMGNGYMIHTNTPATGINVKVVTPTSSGLVSVNRVL